MKFSPVAALISFGAIAAAHPGQTATAAGYGSGWSTTSAGGYGGGSGSGSTCKIVTSYITSTGWNESPSTIYTTESQSYTTTVTNYKTIETYVPSTYVTSAYNVIETNIPIPYTVSSSSVYTSYWTSVGTSYSNIKSSIAWATTITTNVPSQTVQEVCSTSTGYNLITSSYITTLKGSWSTVIVQPTTTCNTGGSGGGW